MQERQHLIDIFLKINEQINLSAIRTPEQVYVKHIQDSLIINEIFTFDTTKTLADLGT
jgi:16S rRNA G527 N7-methylase RsmG